MNERAFDPNEILDALDRHGVDYVIVGGVAAVAHGATRLTQDLDVVADFALNNLTRLADALAELNVRIRAEGLDDEVAQTFPTPNAQALERLEISTWRTDAGDFDVLVGLPAADGESRPYADLANRAVEIRFGNRSVRVASLIDIIESKEWADRPKDREALVELRSIRDDSSSTSPDDETLN